MTVAEYILIAFPAIFVILNPFVASSMFLSLTAGQSEEAQVRIAKRACMTAFVVAIIFIVAGHFIFQIFRITVEAFRIAGGVILFGTGLSMMKMQPLLIKQTEEEKQETLSSQKQDVGVIPLGIPILSGPGTITTVMVLLTEINWKLPMIGILQTAGLIFSCALSLVLIYFILINSRKLMDILKLTGIGVMTRIMGLILTVIATQFVINGVKDLLVKLKPLLS